MKSALKKGILLLLTVVYTVAALGISMHFFYCCHKLSRVSLSQSFPIGNCAKKMKKQCCSTKIFNIKLSSEQHKASYEHTTPSFFKTAIFPASSYIGFVNQPICQYNLVLNNTVQYSPPNFPSRQVLFCVFRI